MSAVRVQAPIATPAPAPVTVTVTAPATKQRTTAKPPTSPSAQVRPFKNLPLLSWNRVLTDDFCHSKLLQLKWKWFNGDVAPVQLQGKQVLNLKQGGEGKDAVPRVDLDNVGSWARVTGNVNDYLIEGRAWHNGRFRVVVDSPALDKQRRYNAFTTIRSNAGFNAWKASLGFNHLSNKCKATCRLWTDERSNIVLDEKAVITEGKWLFATYMRLFLNNTRLARYDALVGYQDKDFDVYLQHESDKNVTTVGLGALTASLVYRYNKFNLAAQLKHDAKGDTYTFGTVYNANDKLKIRASLNSNLDLSTAWRYKAHKNYSVILGTQWKLSQGANAINFNNTLPFPIGLTVEATL